jgi:hypothetical protein
LTTPLPSPRCSHAGAKRANRAPRWRAAHEIKH